MSHIPQDHYEPKSGFEKWMHVRLPIIAFVADFLVFPTPKNLNWMWIWGMILSVFLVLQLVTGIVLAMATGSHYDTAGRIRKGPAPRNLDIPPVAFAGDSLLRIG